MGDVFKVKITAGAGLRVLLLVALLLVVGDVASGSRLGGKGLEPGSTVETRALLVGGGALYAVPDRAGRVNLFARKLLERGKDVRLRPVGPRALVGRRSETLLATPRDLALDMTEAALSSVNVGDSIFV